VVGAVLVCASCSPADHDVAFQSCRSLQGAGAAVAFALSSGAVCVTAKLYCIIALLLVAVLFYAVFEYRLRRTADRRTDDVPTAGSRRRESAATDVQPHDLCEFT